MFNGRGRRRFGHCSFYKSHFSCFLLLVVSLFTVSINVVGALAPLLFVSYIVVVVAVALFVFYKKEFPLTSTTDL